MLRWLESWCIPIIVLLFFLVIQFWLQLLAWRRYWDAYLAWKERNCDCKAPGDDPPPGGPPSWP